MEINDMPIRGIYPAEKLIRKIEKPVLQKIEEACKIFYKAADGTDINASLPSALEELAYRNKQWLETRIPSYKAYDGTEVRASLPNALEVLAQKNEDWLSVPTNFMKHLLSVR